VNVTLQWDANSEPDLAGYRVYYQAESSDFPFQGTGTIEGPAPLDVGNQTTATINGLDPGNDYYFAVSAYNTLNLESDYSNIVNILESIPPTVTLNPVTSMTILPSQTLTGTVSDNRPGASVEVIIGSSPPAVATLNGINWSYTVANLAIGSNTITVTATDAAGNTATVPETTITRFHPGPANRDGTISIIDAQQSLNFVLGLATPTSEQVVRSDVAPIDMTTHQPKPDGKLDIDDVLIMLRRAVGLAW
jgi:hypothetical protein